MLALLLLVALQDPNALVRRLAHDNIDVRDEASAGLRTLGMKAADALLEVADTADPEVRTRALAILSPLVDELPAAAVERIAALREARDSRRFEAVYAAVLAEEVPHSGSRDSLVKASVAWERLAALGPEAVPRILGKLDGTHRIHAILALGLYDDRRASKALDAIIERDELVTWKSALD